MKKIFCIILLFALGTVTSNAQLLVGDMNGDGSLDVSDVTVMVSTILGNSEKQYIFGKDIVISNHEYVDLGLPSGTLWATTNIGAENPEDDGDYFAWGETVGYNDGKTTFSWSAYKWCNDSYTTLTKYCDNSFYGYDGFVDMLKELEFLDDAAYMNWGSNWCMPSKEQFLELISSKYTTSVWTKINGKNGYLITSKSNGKNIFLPAADSRHATSFDYTGVSGLYWSRTLSSIYPTDGWYLLFDSGHVYEDGSCGRCRGQSVRPVRFSLATDVLLDQTSLFMKSGTTSQLVATVVPSAALNAGITWTSSDENVATVDANGLITAVAGGSCSISAIANGSLVKGTCNVSVMQMVTSITLSQTTAGLNLNNSVYLTATVLPENAANRNVVWSSNNEGVATVLNGRVDAYGYGTAVVTCTAQDGSGVTATCTIAVSEGEQHEFVDLGLPSGTLWATFNIGAETPEDYGEYFAWGEVKPHEDNAYSWASYKYAIDSSNTLTKYCGVSSYGNEGFTDALYELEHPDDAAYVNWGPAWCMPSEEQFRELINSEYTTTEWTTQNGVNGRKITSKTNGSTLFLPAAGCRNYSYLEDVGSNGGYWSRTLYSGFPFSAWYLDSNSSSVFTSSTGIRCNGRSVRPVRFAE